MNSKKQIVVYGSYGYTGKLIVEQCKARQLNVMLAGRNANALQLQSKESGYPFEVVEIKETEKLKQLLTPATLVIHCGGPFLFTAKRMVQACLETSTHYTDITGEIAVFELLNQYSQKGKEAGVMILPGAGFDVVPTDCLALHLKNRLPDATHLELAFAMSGGGTSRGTSKTAILGLGEGSRVRKDGRIVHVPLHEGIKEIDFGNFKTSSARIPWGDVSTAFHSTQIPNIEVYMGINSKIKKLVKSTRYVNWLLKQNWLKGFLLKRMDRTDGPSQSKREVSKCFLTGKAWNENKSVQSLMETPDGYSFTANSSVTIAEKILHDNFKAGFQTPSLAYGADLVLELNGKRKDL